MVGGTRQERRRFGAGRQAKILGRKPARRLGPNGPPVMGFFARDTVGIYQERASTKVALTAMREGGPRLAGDGVDAAGCGRARGGSDEGRRAGAARVLKATVFLPFDLNQRKLAGAAGLTVGP